MNVNIVEIAKDVFHDKKLIINEIDNDKIKIWYEDIRGNYNRKSFVFPKKIKIDEEFISGLGLFLGDGDMHRKDKNHLTYTSIDKDIAKHALEFLLNKFNLQIKDITFTVTYKKENESLQKEWSSFLKIPEDKIYKRFSNRHKNESMQIEVNGLIFRKIFDAIAEKVVNSNFLDNNNLRLAFLRGIFAAEGCIGIDYLEKKPYIIQISFSISTTEAQLKTLICKSLEKEEISYEINIDEGRHSLRINISNWKNYLKLWNFNLFDYSYRKKEIFKKVAKNLDIYFELNKDFRASFFRSLNMFQKDIAKIINSWQANVSRTIIGMHLLKIEQIMKLLDYSTYTKEDLINNINLMRIGSLTKLELNQTTLNFLKEFKSF